MSGMRPKSDGAGRMPEMPRTACSPSAPGGALGERRIADFPAVLRARGAVGDDGAQPPLAGGGVQQHLAAERRADAGDALGVDVGAP